jgi:hypothetical protein
MHRVLSVAVALALSAVPAFAAELASYTMTNAAHYAQRGNANNTNVNFTPGTTGSTYRYITAAGTLTAVSPDAYASSLRIQPSAGGLATGPGTPKGQSYFRFSNTSTFTGTIDASATILVPGGAPTGVSTHFEAYSPDQESWVPGLDGRSTITYRFHDSLAGAAEFSGAITSTDPTHHRVANFNADPNGFRILDLGNASANAVNYDLVPFYVATSGSYTMGIATSYDSYLALYHDSFDPANAVTNAQHANDEGYNVLRRSSLGSLDVDNDTNGTSRFDDELVAGTQYYLVVSTYQNGLTGNYFGQIVGPGNVTLGVVPEPTSAVALLALAMVRRRR